MLDEAVSKYDPHFTQRALLAFRNDSAVMVSRRQGHRPERPPSGDGEHQTIADFTAQRHEMRTSAKERVPAGDVTCQRASTPPSSVIGSGFDDRCCSHDIPPGHDNWRPVTGLRCQKLEVDRFRPRGQLFDEPEVG